MKKHSAYLLCVILLILSLATTTTIFAAETYYVDGDWKYSTSTVAKTEYSIAAYLGENTRVKVPATFLGKPVVKISDGAFINHPYLQYCEIPATITEIGQDSFYGCNQLKQIVIPKNVESIGKYAFYGCTTMVMVQIESNPSVKVIPEQAFNNCYALSMVNLSEGVEKIDKLAFNNCSMLSSIIIPPSVTDISDDAFNGCITLSILGWEDTYAQQYANKNSIRFVSMGNYQDPTEPPKLPTAPTKETSIAVTSIIETEPSEIVVSSTVTEVPGSSGIDVETTNSSIATDPTEQESSGFMEDTDPTEETSIDNTTLSSEVTSTIANQESTSITTESNPVFKKYFIGDSDLDGRVTIKDATSIQKFVAKIIDFDQHQKFLANTDGKSGITVKDATQIQKYLAGYKDILFIGTEVEL